MKKTVFVAAASIVGAFPISNTLAADASWTGLYGGLSVGYQDGQVRGAHGGDLDYYGITDPDTSSPTGGVFGGYNYRIPQSAFVTGIEASFNVGGEGQSKAGTNFTFSHPRSKASVPDEAAVKARLGYAVGQFLPYLQAGVVGANTRYHTSDDDGFQAGMNKFVPGWLAGVGVDYAIKDNIFLRGSYSYTRLASKDYLNLAGFKDHFELNDFQIGVGYKF